MASQYYFRQDEAITGPVSFAELVSRAREKSLHLEDAVRLDNQSDWLPAGEIAGLFHMAGRADEVSRWRAERRGKGSQGAAVGGQGAGAVIEKAEARAVRAATTDSTVHPRPDSPPFSFSSRGDGGVEAASPALVKSPLSSDRPVQRTVEADVAPVLLEVTPVEGEEGPDPGLSREIQAATYAATRQLLDKYGRPVPDAGPVGESRWGAAVQEGIERCFQSVKFLGTIPFVLFMALWSRLGGQGALPRWVEEVLDVVFSRETLITAFRWGMTLAVPNLVAFGILSWSNVEAQRYPPRDKMQVQPKAFPIWGTCSSEGEYTFLLIDTMLAAGIGTYVGIRWLEALAEDD